MRFLVTAIVVVTASGLVTAADQWPQFRGPNAGVVADDPGAARHLERNRERRLEDRRARSRLELADRLGRSHLPDVGDQRRQGAAAGPRPLRRARPRQGGGRRSAGWSTTSTSRPASCAGSARCTRARRRCSATSRTATRRRRRSPTASVSTSTSATSGWSPRSTSRATSSGRRTSARTTRRWSSAPARRPVLYKDRLFIVNDNTTQSFLIAFDSKTGQGAVAGQPRRARQLVDAGRLGERAADRDRHHRARSRTARTTSTASSCGS